MYEQHWRYMKRIIELGDGPGLYARYNTNLSKVKYRNTNLYSDILDHIRDWQICASIDGTSEIGEYIRSGLNYTNWLDNFKQGLQHSKHRRMMRLDFTLTLPGLYEVINICKLAKELKVDILAKVTFGFTPDIAMSPLFLPRNLLEKNVNAIIKDVDNPVMHNMLTSLLDRPTFEEQFPNEYSEARLAGKRRMDRMDQLRKGMQFQDCILDNQTRKWWNEIS